MRHYIAIPNGKAVLLTASHKGKVVKCPRSPSWRGNSVGFLRLYCRRNGWPFYEVEAPWL